MSPQYALPESRREHILAAVAAHGAVRVSALAEELGLSPVTIRRDINRLAEEGLLEQVRGGARAIEAPGVQPRQGSAWTVGLVTPSLDFFWPAIINGINTVADRAGARVVLHGSTFAAADNLREIQDLAADDAADGLLLVPDLEGPGSAELVAFLEELRKPTVLIERSLLPHGRFPRAFESVSTDHRTGASMAVRHLADLGHRRIGLLTDKRIPSRHLIRAGWQETLAGLDLDTASPHGDTTEAVDDARTARISTFLDQCLASGTTALLVHSDEAALVVVEMLTARGLSVPEDLSVIAYDDELAHLARPSLTAVSPPKAELGETAMTTLLERLEHPERALRQVTLTPALVTRCSTAAPRAAGATASLSTEPQG